MRRYDVVLSGNEIMSGWDAILTVLQEDDDEQPAPVKRLQTGLMAGLA